MPRRGTLFMSNIHGILKLESHAILFIIDFAEKIFLIKGSAWYKT